MLNTKINRIAIIFALFFGISHSQSVNDISKIKSAINKSQFPQNQIPNSQTDNLGLPSNITMNQLSIEKDSLDATAKFFGYDFFTKRDSVNLWANLPTPPRYVLGPGDQLILTLWGETQLRKKYIIDKEGNIYDDKIGLVNLNGLLRQEAEKFLKSQFSRVYSTIKGGSPTTFINLSMGSLRKINVNFVGQLKYPGVYPIHPFSTILTGLIQAGGVDTTGTLRSIYIVRNGKKLKKFDFYQFLLKGNSVGDLQLRDKDIVVVEPRKSDIKVYGAIRRQGVFESLNNESISDIIYYSGGLKPEALDFVSFNRILPLNNRINDDNVTENFYVKFSEYENFKVQNGDSLNVGTIVKNINKVEIIGQVKSPGIYNYFTGMTLYDLLKLGGGINDSTFKKTIYTQRAELIRRDPKTRYESIIEINLNSLINMGKNIPLSNLDRFVVHSNLNYFERENINITGEVNIPGDYPLISENESLRALIVRAGGLTSKALENGISIFRDKKYFDTRKKQPSQKPDKDLTSGKIRVAWKNDSISLMPGDSIIVREMTKTINVSGEVYNPGLIEFRSGKSAKYYINSAGGVTENGNHKNIMIIYANGLVAPKKWYNSPNIQDGSTILVNVKEPEVPFNVTQFATNWTSIVSSMITIIILTQQASSN